MANLIYPSEMTRTVIGVGSVGTPITSVASQTATIYTDAGGTTPASIFSYPDDVAISLSHVTLDSNGKLPFFFGPDTTTTTLYVKVGTGPVTPIYARCIGTDDPTQKQYHSSQLSPTPSAASSVSPAWTGAPTVNGYPLAPRVARPNGADQSFRLRASGSGATATQFTVAASNPRGLQGYRFYTPNANSTAYAYSGALGHFDITFTPVLASQTGQTQYLAVVPGYGVTPASPLSPVILEIQFNYGSSQTFTVYGTNAAGSRASFGTLSQATSTVSSIRVRRDAVGYLVRFTQANGTVTDMSFRTHSDLSDSFEGPVTLVLGKLDNSAGIAELQMLVTQFLREPLDNLTPAAGFPATVLAGPLRGANMLHDALLNTEVNRTQVQRRTPSLALAYDYMIAGSVSYQSSGSFAMWNYWQAPFIRDIGDTDFARKQLLNHLTNVQTGGRLAAIVNPSGPVDPGSGRVWSQLVFAQTFALLCHDGDTDWTYLGQSSGALYTVLKNHLTWWEANRLTGRGLALIDDGQEFGWDGAIATNPAGDPAVTPNRFESVIASCSLYCEYQAMIGIANQRGNSADAAAYTTKAANLKTAIQTYLWSNSGGWLFNYDTTLSALSPHYQADAIYALWAGVLTAAQAQTVRDRLMDPTHFLCNFGITSLDKTDAGYLTSGISAPGAWQTNWNGPVWEPPIYLASMGLARYGFTYDAMEIARRGANLYWANLTNSDAFGFIGEWHHPDTGAADVNSHKPFFGWMLLGLRAYLDLARNYDPYFIQTTGTTRGVEHYTRAIA